MDNDVNPESPLCHVYCQCVYRVPALELPPVLIFDVVDESGARWQTFLIMQRKFWSPGLRPSLTWQGLGYVIVTEVVQR